MAGASRSKSTSPRRQPTPPAADIEETAPTRESIHDFLNVCEVGVHACDDVIVSVGCIAVAVEGVGLA